MDAKQHYQSILKSRANRLSRLVELDGPDMIVADSGFLLIKALFALYPERLAPKLMALMVKAIRVESEICTRCDNLSKTVLCQECRQKEEAEIAQMEKDMDEPEEH